MNVRSGNGKLPNARHAKLPPHASVDAEERRILSVALRLFATTGFHGTSIRDLAKALEIQPSALYASFPSKDHLLAELVRVGHEAHLAALRAALLGGGSDPKDQIKAVVRANAHMHMAYPHLAVVVNDEMHALPAELAEPGLALRRQGVALLTDIVERGIALRRFAARQPAVAIAAIGAMSMRIPYWYEPNEGPTPDEVADAQVELAVRMLEVRS